MVMGIIPVSFFYVDGILTIHQGIMPIITNLDKQFKLNHDSVGNSDIYLGTKLGQMQLPNGV